jgi:serine/threonine protein kinase
VPSGLKVGIEGALEVLYGKDFVFGDLQLPNIIIMKNQEIKLIDFSWVGKHGESQYPLLRSPNIQWPAGVGPLWIMDKHHDNDILKQLLEFVKWASLVH